MTKSFPKLLYVDGFAGPGVYDGGEPGSPIIAIRAAMYSRTLGARPPGCELGFYFIEERPDRVTRLKQELAKLTSSTPLPAWVKYHVQQGEFESVMTRVFGRLSLRGKRPMFVFIDPFGYAGLPMALIKRISTVPHSECLITFTYKSINRWGGHDNLGKDANIDALYNSTEWRSRRGDERAMVAFYLEQLAKEGGFKYNCSFRMKDRVDITEYFLAFGTNDPKGLSVMKAAMWKADPQTGRLFSDADDPDQLFLDIELEPLRVLLLRGFRGRGWFRMDDVIEFVRQTHYSEGKHLIRDTLVPMEKQIPKVLEVERLPGSRTGTFNQVHRLRFL